MALKQDPKPVPLMLIENTAIDGVHHPAGTLLTDVPPELALDLGQCGKARLATEEDFKAAEAAAKGAKGGK
jgi:hypothetical protein